MKPTAKHSKARYSKQFDNRKEKPYYRQHQYREPQRDPYAYDPYCNDEDSMFSESHRKRVRCGSDYATWMDEFLGTSLKMEAVRDKREYDQLARDRARFDHLSNVNHQRELELTRAKHNN